MNAAGKESDRITLYRNLVGALKEFEDAANQRAKAGRGTEASALRVKAKRLEVSGASGIERRSEERHEGLVDNAIIWFRGTAHAVPVLNISSRGTMVESDIVPRLGGSGFRRSDAGRLRPPSYRPGATEPGSG